MTNFDVVIIGGGPAGASAALYAARGGLSVCVVHSGVSALDKAHSIQNYYGSGTIAGGELYKKGLEQAAEVGALIKSGEVIFCEQTAEGFAVGIKNGDTLNAKTVVISTGASRPAPCIEGLSEFEGKGVSYCAVCDAFFYRKKNVAVLGAGAFAEHELSVLSAVASSVSLITNGEAPSFEAQNVYTGRIKRIAGGDRLSGVKFEDGSELALDGLFVALGTLGASALARSLGVFTEEDGSIKVDAGGGTNIPGLFAAGDCTRGIKQVAKAVCDGMTAGLSAVAYVKRLAK